MFVNYSNQLIGCNENDYTQQCAHERESVHIADHRTVCTYDWNKRVNIILKQSRAAAKKGYTGSLGSGMNDYATVSIQTGPPAGLNR